MRSQEVISSYLPLKDLGIYISDHVWNENEVKTTGIIYLDISWTENKGEKGNWNCQKYLHNSAVVSW